MRSNWRAGCNGAHISNEQSGPTSLHLQPDGVCSCCGPRESRKGETREVAVHLFQRISLHLADVANIFYLHHVWNNHSCTLPDPWERASTGLIHYHSYRSRLAFANLDPLANFPPTRSSKIMKLAIKYCTQLSLRIYRAFLANRDGTPVRPAAVSQKKTP